VIDQSRCGQGEFSSSEAPAPIWSDSAAGISRSDFDQDMILHFCSLPELMEQKKITLKGAEAGAVTLWHEFVIVEGHRRTVCFRNGEKVWEKGDMNGTDVIDGTIYFTDNPDNVARIGMIDLPTGVEHILYTD
jgi:hypothetical protein